MLLRLGKYKEAIDVVGPLQSDAVLKRSKYRQLGLYHVGYAQFALGDYLAAGRLLSQLAPFQQEFGVHARYLLARVHHLSEERPEAALQYKAVLADFETAKKAAQQSLQNPAVLDPERKAQLELLVNGPAPDYVIRARFYAAVLDYEEARYAEAADTFFAILQQQPKTSLASEARLRLGFCWLQSGKFKEAIQNLEPLKDDKQFADRALWWTARAQAAAADANNPDAYRQALAAAMETLRRAAEKARQIAASDPDAKARRVDIILELADTQVLAKQYKEAAATYQQVIAEEAQSDRVEEAMQRRVTALHLAGQFTESDAAAEQFVKAWPKSILMPMVLFRQAENAYLAALAASDGKSPAPREEQTRLLTAALLRYQPFVAKYSEFENIDLARQALATCHARLGHFGDAIAVLRTIPESSRTGELASVPYLLADCEIRMLPAEIEDALTAERLIDTADEAAKLLDNYVSAQPKSPQAPDALLKVGYCYQRMASQMAVADERQKTLAKAKEAYERFLQQFPSDPALPSVVFDRARCMALMGDTGGAQNELRRFTADPLRSTPNAPLALIRLSVLLRSQNQAQAALDVIKRCRDENEAALSKDPARADWVPMLRYEHALALQDLHKLAEARTILEEIVNKYPAHPDAINASWRIAQCRRQEAAEKLAEARAIANRPGANPNEIATAYSHAEEPLHQLTLATEVLAAQADAQAAKAANSPATLAMLYEAAWCNRVLGDGEIDAALATMKRELAEKAKARLQKDAGGSAVPAAADIGPIQAPMQPSEQKARGVLSAGDLCRAGIGAGVAIPV